MKRRRLGLVVQFSKMIWHKKTWFLIPILTMLLIGVLLLVIVESPVLFVFLLRYLLGALENNSVAVLYSAGSDFRLWSQSKWQTLTKCTC